MMNNLKKLKPLSSEQKTGILDISRIVICITTLVSLIIFLFVPYDKEFVVKSGKWERTIEIESMQTINDSGWNKPFGKRNLEIIDKDWRYHYSKKVKVGTHTETYTVNGQTKTKIVTDYETKRVYDWYYTYTYEEYKKNREILTCGNHDKQPVWGELDLVTHNPIQLGDEREGRHVETYTIVVFDPDKPNKTKTYELEYSDFMDSRPDTKLTFKVSRISKKAELSK